MPHVTFPLSNDGPVLSATIGLIISDVTALVNAGQSVPQPLPVRVLIDTGADRTSLAPHVFQHLKLAPFFFATSQTASGAVRVNLYRVDLTVNGPSGRGGPTLSVPDLLVSELTAPLPVDGLIGLDVLRECLLVLDGPGQQFILAF